MVISHEIAVYNDDALKKRFSSIQQTESAITLTVGQKVGYNEVISSINQTAEQIQISAQKIDLRGYATFSDLPTKTSDLANDSNYVNTNQLSTAGQTVIHGGNITTGKISAQYLELSNYATIGQLPTKTSDLTNDSSFLNPTTLNTRLSTQGYTTINGGNITTGKISAQYLELSNYATIGQLPTKTSDLTNDSSFLNPTTLNNRLSTQGYTTINGGNITTGTIAGPSGTFSLNMVTGDVTMNNGHFSGEITASSGSIGGYTIESDYLHKGATIGASDAFWLWPAGSDNSHKATIAASGNIAGWAMTIGSKFGVQNDGTVYSTALVSKGSLQVYNASDKLELELNENGMDVYYADTTVSQFLGKIGSNVYGDGTYYTAVDIVGTHCAGFEVTRRAVGSDQGANLLRVAKDGTITASGSLTVNGGISVPGGQTITGDLETRSTDGFVMDQYGNFRHKSTTTTNSWCIQKKVGSSWTSVFWVYYQTGETGIAGDLSIGGALTISGTLTGSTSEKVENTTYGIKTTIYKNAGTVTAYIHGTTTSELSTSSGYIDLIVPGTSYASWFPKEQLIGYQQYSRNGYRGQVKVLTDRVQIGYTNNASGTAANIPSGTTIYIYVTWAAK